MKINIFHHSVTAMALCLGFFTSVSAQQTETFSIATLNVDGLPGQFLMFNVNQEGPQSEGSMLISKYLADKNCDIFCLQENFNYHWEILSRLFICYNHDEWSGGITILDGDLDIAHLQNFKFKCDGLNTIWKREIKAHNYKRVAWQQNFGKFSHDFDDIITKGFRRYELTLANGNEIVVYNMHMDASSNRDEAKNNDARDRAARLSQWNQLRDDILEHLDERPIIVTGDMNSFYRRDNFKTTFIDAINLTGRATVNDAWIELCNGNVYPKLSSEIPEGETLDKILYINPTKGASIVPVSVTLDKAGYTHNGKPLGDHYPLIATFRISSPTISGIQSATNDASGTTTVYDLNGIRHDKQSSPRQGIYIVDGKKVVK